MLPNKVSAFMEITECAHFVRIGVRAFRAREPITTAKWQLHCDSNIKHLKDMTTFLLRTCQSPRLSRAELSKVGCLGVAVQRSTSDS